jgi:hypothetical protein
MNNEVEKSYNVKNYNPVYSAVYISHVSKNAIIIKEAEGFGFLRCNCVVCKMKNSGLEDEYALPCNFIIEYLKNDLEHIELYKEPSDFSLCLYEKFICNEEEINKLNIKIKNFESFLEE